MIIFSPELIFEVSSFNPVTAGIPNAAAKIPTWDVFPPVSVAKPFMKFLGIVKVSEGLNECVTIITGSSISDNVSWP